VLTLSTTILCIFERQKTVCIASKKCISVQTCASSLLPQVVVCFTAVVCTVVLAGLLASLAVAISTPQRSPVLGIFPWISPPTAVKQDEREVWLGKMLVQKRSPDADAPTAPVPNICVKVSAGVVR
jgi:hypothetical protein